MQMGTEEEHGWMEDQSMWARDRAMGLFKNMKNCKQFHQLGRGIWGLH